MNSLKKSNLENPIEEIDTIAIILAKIVIKNIAIVNRNLLYWEGILWFK